MVFSRTSILAALAISGGVGVSAPAHGTDIYAFNATCSNSYYKKGARGVDLTKNRGTPILCDMAMVSHLNNARTMVEFVDRNSDGPVIGFGTDEDMEGTDKPDVFRISLKHVYLQVVLGGQSVPTDLADGSFCLFQGGREDVREMKAVECIAMIASDTERTVFRIEAHTHGVGKLIHAP